MASHERETLNPSELQTDHDNFFEQNNIMSPKGSPSESNLVSSGWSSYSSPSGFSSPFGSEMGSTGTESEDDDFIAELSQLTRRMAEYTFQDDDEEFEKAAPAGGTASENSDKASCLSAKLSQGNSSSVYYCDKEFVNTSEESNNSDSGLAKSINSEICSDQVSTEEHKRSLQVYELKNQPQIRKQGFEHGGGKRVKGTERSKGPQNMLQNREGKAWRNDHRKRMNPPPPPPVSPQARSGMRAVFIGGSNTRTVSCGTGVFLPNGTYSTATAEPKRKSGCSTVLIPSRVLQTLQQHFNNVGAQSQLISTGRSPNLPWQSDVLTRINGLLSQQKEHVEFQTRPATKHAEQQEEEEEEVVHLPQEWTY